eukprot:gnl/MRDRNA2_/MRDRNA2_128604_c0_seq1.p1 gnl/MRDRNA2_/MRDRNA2_128604_c0~~gnl/MRDRNA2_/MRDRNA2_128604_c0_seq1.p1  ORF type:complete len:272 (+),score=39.65 gnl/MRDRNA2_/MRDRNA2_128604_c0_seq1:101-916(+)
MLPSDASRTLSVMDLRERGHSDGESVSVSSPHSSHQSKHSSEKDRRMADDARTADDVEKWHKLWASSSEDKENSSDRSNFHRSEVSKSGDDRDNIQDGAAKSSKSAADGYKDDPPIFDFEYALEVHATLLHHVKQKATGGVDVSAAIAECYPDLDLRQVVVRGEDGQMLSIGSARHLVDPSGTHCNPCACYRRGNKCYRMMACLHCHFPHTRKECGIHGTTRDRRDRRKKMKAAIAKEQWKPNDGDDEDSFSRGLGETHGSASSGSRIISL